MFFILTSNHKLDWIAGPPPFKVDSDAGVFSRCGPHYVLQDKALVAHYDARCDVLKYLHAL